ncbi:lysM domain-containing protein ARB_03442-like [Miscanthus floridulus]|uniref:lysM domain-containing protein ARB_03442-like n=1 Tax=Miscanthus floridulus TaxID=154761 RepID=UPI003459C0D9
MANQRAAAALLLIASLFVAVAISGADARPSVRPSKTAALRHDAHGGGYVADAATPTEPKPELEPEEPKKPEEPEEPKKPESELTCNKVHGVLAGETCCSVGEGARLSQDQFLFFNPNLCCEKLFVGQWVCLEATSGCHD